MRPVARINFKTHLHRHADRRHGIALVTGGTTHSFGNAMRFMRSGAGRAGRAGRRRIVNQTGGRAAVDIGGNRRIAMTSIAARSEAF